MSNIKLTKLALKSWNSFHFGHIQSRISEIKRYIELLQHLPPSQYILEQENSANKELDEILEREQIFWREKAKGN